MRGRHFLRAGPSFHTKTSNNKMVLLSLVPLCLAAEWDLKAALEERKQIQDDILVLHQKAKESSRLRGKPTLKFFAYPSLLKQQ
jgi:hypothetical protein